MLKLKEHPITTISMLFLITQHNFAFSSDSEIFAGLPQAALETLANAPQALSLTAKKQYKRSKTTHL
ncbi:hypothetical protein NMC42_19435 [Pseudomonas aeruginosa]